MAQPIANTQPGACKRSLSENNESVSHSHTCNQPHVTSDANASSRARPSRLRFTSSVEAEPGKGPNQRTPPAVTTNMGYIDLTALHTRAFPTVFLEDQTLDEDEPAGAAAAACQVPTHSQPTLTKAAASAPQPHARHLTARRSRPASATGADHKAGAAASSSPQPSQDHPSPKSKSSDAQLLSSCSAPPAAGERTSRRSKAPPELGSSASCPQAIKTPRKRIRPPALIKEAELQCQSLNEQLAALQAQQGILVAQRDFLELATRSREVQGKLAAATQSPGVQQLWEARQAAALRLFPDMHALQRTGVDVLRSLVTRLVLDSQVLSASNSNAAESAIDAGIHGFSGDAAAVGSGPGHSAETTYVNSLHGGPASAAAQHMQQHLAASPQDRGSTAPQQSDEQAPTTLGLAAQPSSSGGSLGSSRRTQPSVVMNLNLAELLESPDEDAAADKPARSGPSSSGAANSSHSVSKVSKAPRVPASTPQEVFTAIVGVVKSSEGCVLQHSALQGATLADWVTALPLLVLANPAAAQLMGQTVVAAEAEPAASDDADPAMWSEVLMQLDLQVHQLRLLACMRTALQAGAPGLKNMHGTWLTCVNRLLRLESSRKAQSKQVTLGGPLLRQGELVMESTKLMAASQSLVSLAVEVLMVHVLTPAQVMRLFRLCAPVLPDPIALCAAASVLINGA